MKLTADETSKLIAAADGCPLDTVIGDACEMLTMKAVLLLKKRQKAIKEQRKALPLGDPQANALAEQIRALGAAIVELAEAP